MEAVIALLALSLMEIVLGIDNIIFITILTDRLPESQQPFARRTGLLLAMGTRIGLLAMISWIVSLKDPVFQLTSLGLPREWLQVISDTGWEEVNGVSWRDLIMLVGGLFLIRHSVKEIHEKLEGGHEEHEVTAVRGLGAVLFNIAVMDIIFSLDSVITAVGMAKDLWVMITAVVIAVGVMMAFAGQVSRFVRKHPTLKMLALSFLILIGVMLVAEGIGTHFNKGYVYFAMAFSLGVEALNIRAGRDPLAQRPIVPSASAAADVDLDEV